MNENTQKSTKIYPNNIQMYPNQPKYTKIKKNGSAACRERAKPAGRVSGRNLTPVLIKIGSYQKY